MPCGQPQKMWDCICSCGNTKTISGVNLKSGQTSSCGCLVSELGRLKTDEYIGKKFGMLTVLKRVEDYIAPNGNRQTRVLCECECGNKNHVVTISSLKKDKSCGCKRYELSGKANKKFNHFDNSGEYGICYMRNGKYFLYDIDDFEKIRNHCWREDKNGYIVSNHNNTQLSLHRLIMDFPSGLIIDHKNHQVNDNRKENLRIGTQTNNHMNRNRDRRNVSGHTGVRWEDSKKKWVATITINRKKVYLGFFNSIEPAIKAREDAENKIFGDWSYKNSILGDETVG